MNLLKNTLFLLTIAISTAVCAQNETITFRSKLSFPGQTVANVCGWVSPETGREYALVGASEGLIIVDVTNPDLPVKIVQIPGGHSETIEIKTYSHYAYVLTPGIQIVDLSALPSTNLPSKSYTGDGAIEGQLNYSHTLHIDEKKGFLYTYGGNLFNGGAAVFDLNADPWNPRYVGKFDQFPEIHDGYVDNDTLYAATLYGGFFAIVDMSDKMAPLLLNTQDTPHKYPHNTWLSEDRKTLFTTDEKPDSYMAAYDVSDPTDVRELDRIQAVPGSRAVVHNTHVRGHYAINAWYTLGVNIVDVSKPDNLVQIGIFDTYAPNNGSGFEGCWGVYPNLPSGNLVASNINPGELWILSPTYLRACYLEGKITDGSNDQPILGAKVEILGNASSLDFSNIGGVYRTGRAQPGVAQARISKLGYLPVTASVNLVSGEITTLDVELTHAGNYHVTGKVLRNDHTTPVANAQVSILAEWANYQATTDASGLFSLSNVMGGLYDVVAGKWGYQYRVSSEPIASDHQMTLTLEEGYEDDFLFDYGWEVSGSSVEGLWERTENPLMVNYMDIILLPGEDVHTDVGFACYVTGNASPDFDTDDVENGTVVLTSPPMDLSGYANPRISAQVQCVSINTSIHFLDSIKVYVSNGTAEKLAWASLGNPFFDWRPMAFDVTDFVPLSSTVSIRVVGFDTPDGALPDSYEAAFDHFKVTDQTSGTQHLTALPSLLAIPNPFRGNTLIGYENLEKDGLLMVFDLAGRCVHTQALAQGTGQCVFGEGLPAGVYFVRLSTSGASSSPLKLIKVD